MLLEKKIIKKQEMEIRLTQKSAQMDTLGIDAQKCLDFPLPLFSQWLRFWPF